MVCVPIKYNQFSYGIQLFIIIIIWFRYCHVSDNVSSLNLRYHFRNTRLEVRRNNRVKKIRRTTKRDKCVTKRDEIVFLIQL